MNEVSKKETVKYTCNIISHGGDRYSGELIAEREDDTKLNLFVKVELSNFKMVSDVYRILYDIAIILTSDSYTRGTPIMLTGITISSNTKNYIEFWNNLKNLLRMISNLDDD